MNTVLDFVEKYPKYTDAILLILGFVFGANLLIYFRHAGLDESVLASMYEEHGFHYAVPSIGGFFIGLILFQFEFRLFPKLSTFNKSWTFVLKFVTASFTIVLILFTSQALTNILYFQMEVTLAMAETVSFLRSDVFLSVYVYLMFLAATLNFFKNLGNHFGHGIIIKYLSGKYSEPVEENRVFMFVDLNRSTLIAENLGHVKYSRFLNKCFSDLSEVLPGFGGKIYQYVGDEAVMTWSISKMSDPLNPLLLFDAFEKKLKENSEDYLEKFGVAPTFKAAINSGRVSVSMVGGKRKEMAFHGDVLNTASRVLEQCSKLKKKVLVTEAFLELLNGTPEVTSHYVNDLFLRGKNEKTEVYQPVLNS